MVISFCIRVFALAFTLLIFASEVMAQDERFIRDMLAGKLREKERSSLRESAYRASSPHYKIDLTGDSLNESFVKEFRDGRYWFHLHNHEGKRVFSHKFDVEGVDAELYKVRLKRLSPSTKLLMLYFYEGKASYVNFWGTARLYFLTIDNNDLSSVSVKKGPAYWSESRHLEKSYWRRKREISVVDLNDDQKREVLLKNHDYSEVYFYLGNGKWDSI